MAFRVIAGVWIILLLAGCERNAGDPATANTPPGKTAVDPSGPKKVADAFMADLVKNRVNDALNEMEPDFVQALGRDKAEAQIRQLFDYCGRPLDAEFKHAEDGFKVYLDGRRSPVRKFYYAATTTQHPKGECFFAVEVVPFAADFKVTTFGPLKLQFGELPVWLR